MKSKIVARIIAVVICIVIYAIYISIAIAMDWKSGGGIIVIAILLGIFRYVWKFAGKIGEEMDSQLQEKDTTTSDHLLEPITEDTQVQEQSTISDIEEEDCPSYIPNVELQPSTTENTAQPVQLELNSILNALFTLWILYAFIASLVEFIINVEGDYLIGGLDFAFNLVGIIGTIGLILKKRWGIFTLAIFFLLQFIIYSYVATSDSTYSTEAIKVLLKVVIFTALLFIRKNGYSAWKTIWNNGLILETEEDNQSEQLMLNPTDSKMEKADSSSIAGSELSSTSTQETVEIQHTGIVENQTKKINKTHWSKYRLYYTIVFIISTITIIIVSFSIHVYQKQQRELQIEELAQKAKEAYNLSFYDLALNHLEEALLFDSHNLVINYCIGRVNYKQGNYLKAQEYFEKVYNHNVQKEDFFLGEDTVPFNKLLYNYCRALRNSSYSDHHKLMLISQEYISLYPNESNAYISIIFAYNVIGNNKQAKEWAQKMVNKFPQDADSYLYLACILTEMQQYIESITNYKKAITLNPNSSSAYNNLGLCYYELGQKQHAYKCWRMAYELGDNETAPNNLKKAKQSVITNKQWLYKTLKQLGYQLGTEEQYIESLLTNPNEINWSYNDATNEKLGVGTKEEFRKLLLLDIR